MSELAITGELSNSKLAAVFDSETTARAAVAAVVAEAGLQPAQVKLVTPGEPHPGIKLQPEGQGILRTLLTAHLKLGLAGVVVGALIYALLMWRGVTLIASSPLLACIVFVFFGGVAGLMLGGLVTLRPDQDRYILATRDAIAEGRTTLVVHALSGDEADRAAAVLTARGAEVTRTL